MIRQYRKQWLKWHDGYERTARIIFQSTFKQIAKDIPFQKMTEGTYKAYLETHVSKEKIFDSYVKVYSEVGTKHGKRVGVQINKQINQKNFSVDGFLNEFQRTLIDFLVTNEGSRITSVRRSYVKFLTQIMSKGIEEGKTISMISTDMTKLIKSRNFYRWQALRIARTETTAASNYAATVSSSVSGVLMDKVWISALDARTRRPPESKFDHYNMNQIKVPLDKPFNVSGENLMFPGDPNGSGSNVVNCRCSVAQVVRRNADGNIMRVGDVPKIPNTEVNTNIFRPAKTLKDAEDFAIKNGIKVNYNNLTLKQANSINKAVNNVKNKLKKDISLGIKEIKIVDSGDFHARADKGVLSINGKTWKDDILKKHNSNLSETKQKRLKEIKRLKQEILDDPEEYYINKKRLLEEIDFNENWLKELNGKVEFSTVSTDIVSATEHELGHYINKYLSKNSKYTDQFVGNISRLNSGDRSQLMYRLDSIAEKEGYKIGQYATRNASEYFAESWAAFMQGKNNIINKELLNIFKLISK